MKTTICILLLLVGQSFGQNLSFTGSYIQNSHLNNDSVQCIKLNTAKRVTQIKDYLSNTTSHPNTTGSSNLSNNGRLDTNRIYTKPDIDFKNVGVWKKTVDNIWVKAIMIDYDSLYKGVELVFEKFKIDSTDLIVIKNDKNEIIETFTAVDNNKYNHNRSSYIITKNVRVELQTKNEPSNCQTDLQLTYVKNGVYLSGINIGFSESSCQVELYKHLNGHLFQDVKHAVVMLIYDDPNIDNIGTSDFDLEGSGAIINNTSGNFDTYVLSAGHNWSDRCRPSPGSIRDRFNPMYWKAYMNYRYDGNTVFNNNSRKSYLLGGTVVAKLCENDNVLFRFDDKPDLRQKIYFSGWNVGEINPQNLINAAALGHPAASDLKIITGNTTQGEGSTFVVESIGVPLPQSPSQFEFPNGVAQGGQSGGPLFLNNGQIVGVVSENLLSDANGLALCNDNPSVFVSNRMRCRGIKPFYNSIESYFKHYIDPIGSDVTSLNGSYYCPENTIYMSNSFYYNFYRNSSLQTAKNVVWTDLYTWQGSVEIQVSEKIRIQPNVISKIELKNNLRLSAYVCGTGNFSARKEVVEAKENDVQTQISKYIDVYPNPNNGTFCIKQKMKDEFIEINIYDLQGKNVYHTNLFEEINSIILPENLSGLLFLHCIGKNSNERIKFLVNK